MARILSGIQAKRCSPYAVVIPSLGEESLTIATRSVQPFAEVRFLCFPPNDS